MTAASEIYQHGLALTNQRRYPDARRELERARASEPDADLDARISGTLAYVLTQLGEAAEGERLCREVLQSGGIGDHTRGVVAGQLGSLLSTQGRLDEALEWLGYAVDTIPDDPMAVANVRMNRSVLHMQRAELSAAADDLERAIEVFRLHGEPVEVAEAQHNLGYVALLRGDLVRAMREMDAARPVIAEASTANAAIADVDMAEVLRDAGLVTQAERLLERAAEAFGATRMPQARAEAELHRAKSLLRHDPDAAARLARAAARRFDRLGAHSWQARADGLRLRAALGGGTMDRAGRIVARRGAAGDAEIARVARALTRGGLRTDAAALRLSRELWRARHAQGSGRLPELPESASIELRVLAHEVRATRAARAGRSARAREHAAAGLDELTAWRGSFGSLDLQSSVAMHGMGLMLVGIDEAVASGRPDLVFEWSERARQLSSQVVPLRPPPDPESAADLAELRMLRADLPDADWLSDPRAVELGERVRRRQWTSTGSGGVEDRVDLARLQASLDADTAALAYLYGTGGLVCLVVTPADAVVVGIPEWGRVRAAMAGLRADLDMTAGVRTGPFVDVVRRALDARLAEVSRVLLDGPLAHTSARRLVITVPGVLSGLPWAMLPGLRGRVLTLASSASRWATRPAPRVPQRVGLAAGPRVARAGEEVAVAAGAWAGATALVGADATVDAVSTLAAEVDVLHVAAHGRHAADNPLFSGLELDDGVLFGYDIDRMPRVPALVVLSACEVGRSSVRWGEEAIGMTRAWLHAGADCVIAAPVVVADEDAGILLGAVHAELAAGRPPAEALAAASERTGVVAPFQCHGSGF